MQGAECFWVFFLSRSMCFSVRQTQTQTSEVIFLSVVV